MKKYIIKLWPLIIFTIALTARFIFLSQFEKNPFFSIDLKGVDPSLYHEWAQELAKGYWPGSKLLYGHPFYPYLVSFLYKYWAQDPYSVVVIQFLLGSASCVLLYFIAKYIFSSEVGVISSLIAALYGPFLFYEGFLVPNALSIFLNLGAFIMLLNVFEFSNVRRTFLAGLLLGCSLAANSGIAPFVFLAVIWLRRKRPLFGHLILFIVGITLPVFFLSLKHFAVEGHFDSFAAHGGINFYIGNGPGAQGMFKPPLGFIPTAEGLSEDSAKYAEQAAGRRLIAREVSEFWYKQAFIYIKNHPFLWVKLLFKKFVLFWNGLELGDVADYYFVRSTSGALKFMLTFGIIAPLGILGMILARKDFGKAFLLYSGVASFLISCVLFFVNSRYRLSALPFLIIFAGFSVHRICKISVVRDFKRLRIYAAALALFFAFSNARVTAADAITPLYNLSVIYIAKGRYDEAIEISEKLLKKKYDLSAVHFNLGVCYGEKEMLDRAIFEFQETLRFNPNNRDSHFNLGIIYLEMKDYPKALDELAKSLAGTDKDATARYWRGQAYERLGDFKKASDEYKQALRLAPESVALKKALERCLEKLPKTKINLHKG